MKNTTAITIVSLLFLLGCGEKKQSTEEFITVDVTANYPKKELILQDFMDVEYIPLETSDEFLTSAYIRTIGKKIIIANNQSNIPYNVDGDFFIFDRNGKGLRKINRSGQGDGEYMNIGGITLDENTDEIFINSHYTQKVFVYDLFGNFKHSFGYREGSLYFPIYNFDRNHLICMDANQSFSEEKGNRFLIVSKQDGAVAKEIPISYKEKKSAMISTTGTNGNSTSRSPRNQELIPYRDNWILVEPSSDTIYSYSPDHRMTPFIVRTPSSQSMDPEVILFPTVLTDRYYFMQAVKKEYNFSTETGFPRTDLVYDRQEKTIFEYVAYNGDFSDRTPVNLGHELTKLFLINNHEIAFAQKLEAFDLVEAYEKGHLKGRLKEIAATLDEESNPVIMLIKHKK